MAGPFVHRIDPVLADVGGIHLWYYGLTYALGFLTLHLWFRQARRRLGLSLSQVYDFSLLFVLGALIFGRAVEIVFYEWAFYRQHPRYVLSIWLGGMCTHGLIVGAVAGTWLFCALHRRHFLDITDELVIPAAFLLGVGRIGNFIDGQIVGRLTDVPWAVKFPDADGFRHPAVLYDGVKNALLIPLLLLVRRYAAPARGKLTAHFVFWYGFLRIVVDVFRQYPTRLFGIGTGQDLNIVMTLLGAFLLIWCSRWRRQLPVRASRAQDREWLASTLEQPVPESSSAACPLWVKQAALLLLLLLSLTIPSDWTQDVPARYGARHPMRHSRLYPPIGTTAP